MQDRVREFLAEQLREFREKAAEARRCAASSPNPELREALRATEGLTAQAEDWTNENLGSLREIVREQPVAACLVSAGIGAILGLLLFRR